jgi:hypothetical protein
MRAKQFILLLFILAFFQSLCKAQNESDKITIKLEQPNATVTLRLLTVKKLNAFPDINKEIDLVLRNLEQMEIDTMDPDLATKIEVSFDRQGERQIKLSQHPPKTTRYFQDKTMQLHKAPKDSLLIQYSQIESATIALHQMDDLHLLNEINWKQKLETQAKPANYRHVNKGDIYEEELNLQNKNGLLNVSWKNKQTRDQIVIALYTGAGVLKNEFTTHFGGEIGFSFIGKNRYNKSFGVGYEAILDFNKQNGHTQRHVNLFTDLFYTFNSTPWAKNANMLRVNVGYLTKRRGELFEKNTFRLGFTRDLGHNLRITPELYFPGKFKKINPGLKISYWF